MFTLIFADELQQALERSNVISDVLHSDAVPLKLMDVQHQIQATRELFQQHGENW